MAIAGARAYGALKALLLVGSMGKASGVGSGAETMADKRI